MTSETKRARVAFIGCGGHATRSLLPCVHEIPEMELVATCDLRPDLAQDRARRFGAGAWYTDFRRMLEEELPEGVVICGPPQMHHELGLECLRAGFPIFVEKPSALDSARAQELADAAAQRGLFGMVAFMKRYAAAFVMAQQIVARPEFGGINIVEARFGQGPYPAIWGIESAARSFLVGQVVHIFDLVRAFGGDVAEVHARYFEKTPNHFGYVADLQFASGAIGLLNLNGLENREGFRDFTERLAISGHEHYLQVDDMLYVHFQAARDWLEPPPGFRVGKQSYRFEPTGSGAPSMSWLLGYVGELRAFAESLLSRQPARADLADGAQALKLGEAVWRSVQEGRAVAVE